MVKFLSVFRYLSLIAIICTLIGSLLLFIVGIWETITALRIVIFDYTPVHLEHMAFTDRATTFLLKSLDTFLIALVLMIFAKGVYGLFISNSGEQKVGIFKWISIPNIGHLKNILAEVIIVILFVIFLEVIFENIDNLKWEFLILPVSILILSLGLKFLSLKEKDDK